MLFHRFLFGKRFNKRKYYLVLYDKTCYVLQFSTNVLWSPNEIVESNLPRDVCSVRLLLGNVPKSSRMWRYYVTGYLEHNVKLSKFLALGHAEFKAETTIVEWDHKKEMQSGNFKCHHCKTEKMCCNITSEKRNVLYLMEYYVRTPTHKATISFRIDACAWSYSWTNYILSPSNRTPEESVRNLLHIGPNPYYVEKVVRRADTTFNMKIYTSDTTDLEISIETAAVTSKLKWTKVYQIKRYMRHRVLIALPSGIKSVTLKLTTGNVSKVAEIIYYWMYMKIPEYTKAKYVQYSFKQSPLYVPLFKRRRSRLSSRIKRA